MEVQSFPGTATADNARFDAEAWNRELGRIASTIPSCGQIAELFAERFSTAVDDAIAGLPEAHQEAARAIARSHPNYFDPSDDSDDDDGSCPHGLDPNTCPAGCG